MRKIGILLIVLFGIFIGGCSQKIEKSITFDNYKIILNTKYNYQETSANTTEGAPIMRQYLQQTNTGFIGSILIAKTNLQTGVNIDIEEFANINNKSMSKRIPGSDSSIDTYSFDCGSASIKAVIEEIKIKENDEKHYLNQVFFATKHSLYGISTMTSDKKESKNLANSIEKIICTISSGNILQLNN